MKLDVAADAIEADLEKNYVETIWEAGGIDPVAEHTAAAAAEST